MGESQNEPGDEAVNYEQIDNPTGFRSRIRASLLAGAIGDALGAPIEFMSLAEIRDQYGHLGLQEFVPAYGRLGAITDDLAWIVTDGFDGEAITEEVWNRYPGW